MFRGWAGVQNRAEPACDFTANPVFGGQCNADVPSCVLWGCCFVPVSYRTAHSMLGWLSHHLPMYNTESRV
jgi:hypothetical protein